METLRRAFPVPEGRRPPLPCPSAASGRRGLRGTTKRQEGRVAVFTLF